MNRKQRRLLQSQDKYNATVTLAGNSYTIEEACALAIQYYNQQNFEAVADILQLVVAKAPDRIDVHNNLGCALQGLGRYEEALVNHDKVIALKPDFADAYNNRGVTLQSLKRYDEALASYDKALIVKPGCVMTYNNRGAVLQALKRYDEALASYDKALSIQPDAVAYNNLGAALQEMRQYAKALACYDKAIALKPDYVEAHNNRGLILHEMCRYTEALTSCDKAIALNPYYTMAYNNQSIILQKLKRYDEALISCNKAIALHPSYADAWNNRGDILVSKGNMQEAEQAFLKALALKPDSPTALFGLTAMRKYQDASHADAKAIQMLLDKPGISLSDRELLCFSLGKIYDDCGLYDEAFECYRQANDICNAMASYDKPKVIDTTNGIIDVFSKDFLAQPLSFASTSQQPLFVFGMPRSGTTLIASILSNHHAIATAGELLTIRECASHLPLLLGGIAPYPRAMKHITPTIAARLIHDYEQQLQRNTAPDTPYIIDKHPMNFFNLGFIAMLFPNARFIHCTRHPLDTGLSNYFQRFSLDYSYAFDLRNIGHFYREYARIMDHWRKVLPGKMIEVSYEDMIMDTEKTARRALDFLGLEWDEHCLAPHTNTCAIETASKWQVRQPIYKQSVERWRHYEKHLQPLLAKLTDNPGLL